MTVPLRPDQLEALLVEDQPLTGQDFDQLVEREFAAPIHPHARVAGLARSLGRFIARKGREVVQQPRETVAGELAGAGESITATEQGLRTLAEAAPTAPGADVTTLLGRVIDRALGPVAARKATLRETAEQSPLRGIVGRLGTDIAQIGLTGGTAAAGIPSALGRAAVSGPLVTGVQAAGSPEESTAGAAAELLEASGAEGAARPLRRIAAHPATRLGSEALLDFALGAMIEGLQGARRGVRPSDRLREVPEEPLPEVLRGSPVEPPSEAARAVERQLIEGPEDVAADAAARARVREELEQAVETGKAPSGKDLTAEQVARARERLATLGEPSAPPSGTLETKLTQGVRAAALDGARAGQTGAQADNLYRQGTPEHDAYNRAYTEAFNVEEAQRPFPGTVGTARSGELLVPTTEKGRAAARRLPPAIEAEVEQGRLLREVAERLALADRIVAEMQPRLPEAGFARQEVTEALTGAGVGGAVGGAVGATTADDPRRGAIRGALLGATAGLTGAVGARLAFRSLKRPQTIRRAVDEAQEVRRVVGAEGPDLAEARVQAQRSRAAAGQAVPIRPPEPDVEVKPRTVRSAVRGFLRRNFTSKGDLPDPVFRRMLARDGSVNAQLQQVAFTTRDFRRAVKQDVGARGLSDQDFLETLDEALKGVIPFDVLPWPNVRRMVSRMRDEIDDLSRRMIDVGAVEGDLVATVTNNLGTYATRSYRVFDDPGWAKKVPQDVRNKAKALLRSEFPDAPPEEIAGMIETLLFKGPGADSPMALLSKSNLGSKDLSILQRRKDIAPEIRALWGEYDDPLVNYTRSMTKMTHLIENHRFLTQVREEGLGRFFFERPVVQQGIPFQAKIAAEGSRTIAPLNGLYTNPEILRAFREAVEPTQAPDWLRAYMLVNSTVKFAKTVGSLMTHVRNTVGNVGFAVANGHWRAHKGAKAIRATLAANLPVGDTPAYREFFRKMQSIGVVHESARAGELADVLGDVMRRDIDDPSLGIAGRAVRKGLKGLTAAYRAEDDVWKIYAFLNEQARYRKALPDLADAQVDELAAEIVRNTYPTYSLVPRGVKLLRRFPLVGTFVSFPAEVLRTGTNTLRLAAKELADPQTLPIGAQRLAGILAAATGVAAAAAASRQMLGMTKEDDAAVRRFLPPWAKQSDLVFLSRADDGKVKYVDLSYTDPYSYLRKPVMVLLRGGDWEQAVIEAATEAASPFIEEEILAEKLLDIRRNRRRDGRSVFNPQDAPMDRGMDILAHVLDALEPGTVSSAERIARGIAGKTTVHGRSYDPKLETIAVFTGHRLQELDAPQSLSFKARDFQRDMGEARRVLTSVASRGGTVSDAELRDAYTSSERSRFRLFQELHADYLAARRLGLTAQAAALVLDGAGLTKAEVRGVVDGIYVPYQPTRRFLGSVLESRLSLTQSDEERRRIRQDFQRRLRVIHEAAQAAVTEQSP